MGSPSADLITKDVTGSTNDDARDLALAGAPAGTAVLARSQSHGRGRAGRSFDSPEGGLYLSVVLRPKLAPEEWSLLPLLAGVVVASALRTRGFDAWVKWPNDILLHGEKVGGVLVESRWGNEAFAIVGIGLNLARAPDGIDGVTALARHGEAPDAGALAVELRDALVARVGHWERDGSGPLLSDVRSLCASLGREVVWEEEAGRAVDVADDGALVVELRGGARRRVLAGDVRLRTK
ncbi:MAG: biotin--[acetyl-CoA-carboxylase] ligase [Candidatus Thermoplasmatota archaeon]